MEIVQVAPQTTFYRLIAFRLMQIVLIGAFSIFIWECCNGIGNISRMMKGGPKKAAISNVQHLLLRQEAAWNDGDLDGFMIGYWYDTELAFYSDNTIEKGYEPLKQRYFKKYKAEGKEMGKLTFSNLDINPVSGEFVVARGHWKVEKSKETTEGLFTLWIEKKPEGWRIVHDHTSAAPKAP